MSCSLYCANKALYAECQSWPWPMTLCPQINRVPPLIIHNLHVKFESDWTKAVVCIVSTRSYTQSRKIDLDLWPRDPKWIGFLLSPSTTYMWSLKVIGKNNSIYRVHKVLYTECQRWPWPLTPWLKINRVPPLIIHNLHVKFESNWTKIVVCIVSTRSYTHSAKVDLDLWPRDPKSIGFLLSSSTIYLVHVKFESNWAKTVVCILPTRSYTQSDKVYLDLWTRDPKSIGFSLIIHNLHVKFENDWKKTLVAIVSTR